jgi:hypothetical protein
LFLKIFLYLMFQRSDFLLNILGLRHESLCHQGQPTRS